MKFNPKYLWATIILLLFSLCLFIGQVTFLYDDGTQYHFFVKKKITLRVFFSNPYANDFMGEESAYSWKFDSKGNFLPNTKEFGQFIDYCKYRYGIVNADKRAAHDECEEFIQRLNKKRLSRDTETQ